MNFFNHCCKKCSQQESNPQLVLSRRLLYPFNYGNKCHIFGLFQPFSVTATNFMNSITCVMNHLISYFDISICHCSNRTLCYQLFKFHGFNHGYFLGGPRYIHLTKETNTWLLIQKPCFILPFFFKMHKSLEPDYSAESSSPLWYSQQILLINADIQNDAV